MHLNPFLYGNPVHPNQLIGRRALLRRIVGRIVNQGQSTALVGEPRLGKTSLLPLLSNAEFFGSLRSLASRSRGAFTLVIASRLSLARLNAETQRYNPTGSPFFNIFAEVTLGALAVAEVEQLLMLAGDRFTAADRGYIQALAGGHPYLLQAAAATMWDAYEEGLSDTTRRHHYVWEELRRNQYHQFAETWRAWQPPVRHAFTAIALLTTKEQALPQLPMRLQRFQERLPELMPELNALALAGVLRQTEEPTPSTGSGVGWQIEQGVLLTWLWDELIRELRDENGLGQWLRNAELDGRWDSTQRRQVQELIKALLRTQPNAAINIVLTEGGAYIAGAVNVGGDFIGRDQI